MVRRHWRGAAQGEGDLSSNKHHREANAALDNLVERFPAAFALSDRKPLKLGIRDDLLARGVAPEVASAGLRLYCWSGRYFKAVKAGAPRIDLDGNPAGVVTADEAEHAARKLVEMDAREKQKAAARKVAEEEAKAAAVKKAQAAVQLQPKGTQEPRKGPTPPAGAKVTRQPPLIVRKITRGPSGKR